MPEPKCLADCEEAIFENSIRNLIYLDQIYIQAKNITALKKGALPIIYRAFNKESEVFYSLKKREMLQKAGEKDLAAACLTEAKNAIDEAKKAEEELLQTIRRKGYNISEPFKNNMA